MRFSILPTLLAIPTLIAAIPLTPYHPSTSGLAPVRRFEHVVTPIVANARRQDAVDNLLNTSPNDVLQDVDGSSSASSGNGGSTSTSTCSNGLLTGGCTSGSSSNSTSAATSSECGFLSGCTSGSASSCSDQNNISAGSNSTQQTSSSLCGSSTDDSSSPAISAKVRRWLRKMDVAAKRTWDAYYA